MAGADRNLALLSDRLHNSAMSPVFVEFLEPIAIGVVAVFALLIATQIRMPNRSLRETRRRAK